MLCHSGAKCTDATIRQHLMWPGLRNHVLACIQKCDICQQYKNQKCHYGHLPSKKVEAQPWEVLCVHLIGPYQIRRKGKTIKVTCSNHDRATQQLDGLRLLKFPAKDLLQ